MQLIFSSHEYKGEMRKSNKVGRYLPSEKKKLDLDESDLPFEI